MTEVSAVLVAAGAVLLSVGAGRGAQAQGFIRASSGYTLSDSAGCRKTG